MCAGMTRRARFRRSSDALNRSRTWPGFEPAASAAHPPARSGTVVRPIYSRLSRELTCRKCIWPGILRVVNSLNCGVQVSVEKSENEHLQKAIAGDIPDLELLLEKQSPTLTVYIERHLPQELRTVLEPQDILQDTFFEAFRRIGQFKPKGGHAFYRWLVTIARNRIKYVLREKLALKRGGKNAAQGDGEQEDESTVKLLQEFAVYSKTPSQSAARHEAMAAVEQCLARLPDDCREAIRLLHLEGLGAQEAAALMNRTKHAFHMLCYRGMQALRIELRSASLYL